MRVAAYVYPGWHPIPERDESFHPGFTEWELVRACEPRFGGHAQPRVPLLGEYDDRDPAEVARRVQLARDHGVDALVYGFFWCRGKRVFQDGLDLGLLGSEVGREMPFALMWANRMPRRVLPVRRSEAPVIEGTRRVRTDREDFVALIAYVAERYFALPNYLRVADKVYFSIFDSTFFVNELGADTARAAIEDARAWLRQAGYGELHLNAIDPSRHVIGSVAEVGFDSVTHYVLLPEWRGELTQDYEACATKRAGEWSGYAERSGLPYFPSVATGWDASPRAADFGVERPRKYPWSPVVVGEHPRRFQAALERALEFSAGQADPLVFLASLNEWSEGHYLEPDERFGYGWLEAVRAARATRNHSG
ncbi:MAG: glycoside hydrolase family 99-like domain-containing protein [Planctomycetes bacterium]|nr:glycoside hydrolase family 99-like domain-containing protein [Planctomycetota bacterium]